MTERKLNQMFDYTDFSNGLSPAAKAQAPMSSTIKQQANRINKTKRNNTIKNNCSLFPTYQQFDNSLKVHLALT